MYKFFKTNNLQIIRFAISGIIASAINFLVYNLIFHIAKKILFAAILGYLAGLLVSFMFAKFWVFRNRSKKSLFRTFYIFSLVYFLGGIEMSCVIVFLNKLLNNHKIAWLFGAFIGSLNNYLGSKYISFKK